MMPLTWVPRKIRAMIATIAMSARIRAYSARPWPSSSLRMDEMSAMKLGHWWFTSFPRDLPGGCRAPKVRVTIGRCQACRRELWCVGKTKDRRASKARRSIRFGFATVLVRRTGRPYEAWC